MSAVELLLLANLLTAAVLLAVWRADYGFELAQLMRRWHGSIRHPWDFVLAVPTLFLHAGPGHLLRNLLGLVAAAGSVEVFWGRTRTCLIYLLTGFIGSLFSYLGHMRPPLSVGASGAVFGLAGAMVAFLVRFYPRFTGRQKWKTRRVYGPLCLLLVAPSLFQADAWAHAGGFLSGILAGLMVPLDPEGERLLGGGESAAGPEAGTGPPDEKSGAAPAAAPPPSGPVDGIT